MNCPVSKFELWFCNLEVIPQLGDDLQFGNDSQLHSQLGGHFAAKGQFRSHFATKEHFHRPFRSCEMRGWGCEMALMCQGVVLQLRNTLRNFRSSIHLALHSCLQTTITSSFQLQFVYLITTKKCYFVDLIIMVLSTFE